MAGFDRLEPLQEKIFAEKLKFQVNYRNFSGVFGKKHFWLFSIDWRPCRKILSQEKQVLHRIIIIILRFLVLK